MTDYLLYKRKIKTQCARQGASKNCRERLTSLSNAREGKSVLLSSQKTVMGLINVGDDSIDFRQITKTKKSLTFNPG